MKKFLAATILILLISLSTVPAALPQGADNVRFGDQEEHFSGTASDVAASLPSGAAFAKTTYWLVIFNDDASHALYVKLTGTGATTTTGIKIKAGDPPLSIPFNTTRISVICAGGETAAYRVFALERGGL